MNPKVYTRPTGKPLFKEVRICAPQKQELKPYETIKPIFVDRATECHVTPKNESNRMAEYLQVCNTCKVLEPSAGTGALIQAVIANSCPAENITAVERHNTLASSLNFDGVTIHNKCFLEFAANKKNGTFSRIIMNPPFKQIKAHMKAAIELLDENERSILIALVPTTYQNEEAETLEFLPNDTFAACNVNTKIVKITNEFRRYY